jgi:hypothetical protein
MQDTASEESNDALYFVNYELEKVAKKGSRMGMCGL